jgi:choline dehydrogenase-like flavoprotein
VTKEEVDRLMKLFALADRHGESFERSIQVALEAVLVSPGFLFRGELQPEPNNPGMVQPVDEFALASRLSYFLWSSMPDEELFALAGRNALRKHLEQQVRRMLRDPKAGALVENFAGQWLQIRNLKLVAPDKMTFPDFDDNLRAAMAKETEMFFTEILQQDRSVVEFLDADYTFVNGRLARLYGLPGVTGDDFRRVSLKGTHRGGLLTEAAILTIASTPTRTSPVKRGKWVLENLLGAPPPPPPPDVPELKEGKDAALTGTMRQRMEQHRENPICASCHARMDPIGFGLENFNGIGEWRDKEGDFPIDPAGQLVTGETFNGPGELKSILVKHKRDDFAHCLTEKMLTYALGRGLEYYDKCAMDQITKRLAKNHYRFSTLILEIVKSTPFEMRRGEDEQLAEAAR